MLTLSHINKSYGAIKALNEISFSLKSGEVVGLLGPNGAGKSTLMKILTGYLNDWEGEITWEGLSLKNNRKEFQNKTGYLPENNPLYPELTVLEYLYFVADLYRCEGVDFDNALKQVGLTTVKDQKIATLSKGYRQRVGIAAALLHHPDLLILDEPTTGLDPNQLVEIRKLIRQLGEHKIVLLSTHILSEVENVCDRVIIINQGEIVANEALDHLRKGQQQIIQVSFDYRVETEALMHIDGVEKVVNTFDFDYEIYCTSKEDIRSRVFDFAHDNDLKILALQQKNENLTSLFKQMTKAKRD